MASISDTVRHPTRPTAAFQIFQPQGKQRRVALWFGPSVLSAEMQRRDHGHVQAIWPTRTVPFGSSNLWLKLNKIGLNVFASERHTTVGEIHVVSLWAKPQGQSHGTACRCQSCHNPVPHPRARCYRFHWHSSALYKHQVQHKCMWTRPDYGYSMLLNPARYPFFCFQGSNAL